MPQKRADALRHLGAEDVLEGAGVRFNLAIVAQRQRVHEQALGQPVPADNAGRALACLSVLESAMTFLSVDTAVLSYNKRPIE